MSIEDWGGRFPWLSWSGVGCPPPLHFVVTMTMELEQLETTESGSVRKKDALNWFERLDVSNEDELLRSVVPKPEDHSGSTFPTPISNIRVTGTPEFITQVAKLLKPLLVYESSATRVALKVQQIKDRETEERTDNYALYLSAAERSNSAGMMQALTGSNRANDQRLLDALDGNGGER